MTSFPALSAGATAALVSIFILLVAALPRQILLREARARLIELGLRQRLQEEVADLIADVASASALLGAALAFAFAVTMAAREVVGWGPIAMIAAWMFFVVAVYLCLQRKRWSRLRICRNVIVAGNFCLLLIPLVAGFLSGAE